MARDSSDITIEPGQEAMTEADLRKPRFITPKRSLDDDQGGVAKRPFAPFA